MIEPSLTDFLIQQYRLVAKTDAEASFVGTRLFEMILSGNAKLPLDRVEEVANLLDCDSSNLFRMAMRQFYDDTTIALFTKMLGEGTKMNSRGGST